MNLDVDLQDAIREGYQAYLNRLTINDNPYDNNDEWDLHQAWLAGYYEAGFDD